MEAVHLEKKGIEISLHFPQEPLIRQLDESQIMQVLLNLLKNAAEALHQRHGRIKIELSLEREKVHLDICNDGSPIPEEILPNIFVPFFTTKEEGSGIGLSVSRYIMRLHGGTLTHLTKDGWTIFRMVFLHAGI